ncbi:MAG: CotH kinase family protein [Planctomycetota bacterium]
MAARSLLAATFLGTLLLGSPRAAAQDLFDPAVLHDFEFTIPNANWVVALENATSSNTWVKADLAVDGVLTKDVGVRFHGQSTYFCGGTAKKPIRIETDSFVADQEILGYDDIRLNNGAGDPSLVREVMMGNFLQGFLHCSRRGYARVSVNGAQVGVYVLEESADGKFYESRYGSDDIWRIKTPGASAGLNWAGPNLTYYKQQYQVLKGDPNRAALDIMNLCDRIANGKGGLSPLDATCEVFDLDGAIRHIAANSVFVNYDSYSGNCNNLRIWDDHERKVMGLTLHDLDLSLGTWSNLLPNTSLSYGFPGNPYSQAIKAIPNLIWGDAKLRAEFYAHCRTLRDDVMDWSIVGPAVMNWHALVDSAYPAGTAEIFSYPSFLASIQNDQSGIGSCWSKYAGVANFVIARRAYLQTVHDLNIPPAVFLGVEHAPASPLPDEPVVLSVAIDPSNPAAEVVVASRVDGGFVRRPLYDDGVAPDLVAGDQVFTGEIPGGPGARDIEYYCIAYTAAGAASFEPRTGSLVPHVVPIDRGPDGMRITEYLYAGADGEYVELTNLSSQPIDLAGWSLSDAGANPGEFDLSSAGVVQPGGVVLVTETSPQAFVANWSPPAGTTIVGWKSAPLLGRNDVIHVYDDKGKLRDRLAFGDEDFPGSVRAKDFAASARASAPGADDPYRFELAAEDDHQGSWSSVSGDVGSPGAFAYVERLVAEGSTKVSTASGGTVELGYDCGHLRGGEFGLMLASATATAPGTPLPGGLVLPLVHDGVTDLTIYSALFPDVFENYLVVLDNRGRATARLHVPAQTFVGLAGLKLHHAFVVVDPLLGAQAVSQPVTVELEP